MNVIEVRGASKRYGPRLAVADLDLDVPQGLCLGLLGPNGAGKTTALRMIYGVTWPTAGSIHVFGLDIARNARAVRARIGVTLQESVLIDVLGPEENLKVFGRYHLVREPQLSERVDYLMDFLELRSHAGVPAIKLSGGFRRRLAVAMSLVNEPELLVLDEPTTGLDPAVRHVLWSRVRELRERGTTVLLTTHYMDEAERLCDRVVIMSQGRAVCDGAPRKLIEDHLAREAVELDCTPQEEASLLYPLGGSLRRLRSGRRLVIFADDSVPVVEWIRKHDRGDRRPLIVRPANLEDVFLSETGTALESGA